MNLVRKEVDQAMPELAKAHGRTVDEIMSLPEFADDRAWVERLLMEGATQDINDGMFEAAGGRRTLKAAPGLEAINRELQQICEKEGMIAGGALLKIAAMAKHHSSVPASMARAWAVMAVDDAAGRYTAPPDRPALVRLWRRRGGVAPHFAAHIAFVKMMATPAPGLPALTPEQIARELRKPKSVAWVLGWAEWLRQWATAFRPPRSSSLLLDAQRSLRIVSSVTPEEPPIDRLDRMQLKAAESFQQEYPDFFKPREIAGEFGRAKRQR
ncbi:hypothetical protein [Roseococcus sp. SYP-B2431]|uniref:hypothetical protein n=1 Tax=Roseococcus sp. SYP-B2431 TaxID=2496640 RepID=UPI00103EDB4B|nr:hypothetical protein [Roseococcus sp. SYP-B2431]